jgi:hypothetical protein
MTTTLTEYYMQVNNKDYILLGPDPADKSKLLVRKLVRVSEKTFCYEELRVTPGEKKIPTVHSQIYRVGGFDLHENVSP